MMSPALSVSYNGANKSGVMTEDFSALLADLPKSRKPNSPWHRTKIFPCAAISVCCGCKEFKPVDYFYAIADKKATRRDVLGKCRSSRCNDCQNQSYVKLDQRQKMLYAARHHAKEKGVVCSLTVEDIKIPTHCPVLGFELKPRVGQGRPNCRDLATSPSIDRMIGALGYVPSNINVISTRANHLKSNGTLEEFQGILCYMEECDAGSWPELEITEESNALEVRQRLVQAARKRSKARRLECTLSVEDLKVPALCPVLGVPLRSQWYTGCKTYTGFQYAPSIDRIDNSKGYTANNIRIISARANHLKSDATLEEIRSICDYMTAIVHNDSNGGGGV